MLQELVAVIELSTKKVYTLVLSVIPISNDVERYPLRAQYRGCTTLQKHYKIYSKNKTPLMSKTEYEDKASYECYLSFKCCICKQICFRYSRTEATNFGNFGLGKRFLSSTKQVEIATVHEYNWVDRGDVFFTVVKPGKQQLLAVMHKTCKDLYAMNPFGVNLDEY